MNEKFERNGRRNFLLGLSSLIATVGLGSLKKDSPLSHISRKFIGQTNNLALKTLASKKGIIYGSHVEGKYQDFFADLEFQSLFIKECGLLVPGFQWSRIYDRADAFDFTSTDALIQFATDNQMLIRGQPLIYHQFQPQWLIDKFKNPQTTPDEIRDILVNSINTIVGRYAGKISHWVVANEAIRVADGREDGLRDTTVSSALSKTGWGKYPTWLSFLGAEYIELAFRTAAQADPNALLIYNEYDLCYDTKEQEAKRNAVLNLLKHLKSKNVPIHALGIQSHLDASKNRLFHPRKFRRFLKKVADLDLKIIISELDVCDRDLPFTKRKRDRLVATAYRKILKNALQEPAVISVTTWGLSDRYTWMAWGKERPDKLPLRPLPYNEKLEPKLALTALINGFKNAPIR